jgi:quinoprotein glucose dehydrogenase
MQTAARPRLILVITAAIVALIGIVLLLGGAWLASLGGSLYYLVTAIAMLATAWLLVRRPSAAFWLYALILVGTMIWALGEVGFNFWPLAPRGDILVPLGVWLLLLWIFGHARPLRAGAGWALTGSLVLAAIVLVVALATPHDLRGEVSLADAGLPKPADLASQPDADWRAWGGTNAGDRFSPLTQITPQNVGQLKVAWTFRTGDMKGPNDSIETTDEVTPIKVDHTLYFCSPHQIAFAVDAATGKQKWRFDPEVHDNPTFQHLTCRGVTYHETKPGAVAADGTPAPTDCPRRIFLGTNDARLFALDADTGKPCAGFGTNGVVNLNEGMPETTPGFYEVTSPPVATDRILLVGGSLIDNYSTHEPSGVVRGFDIYSGKLIWAFDSGNEDVNEMPSATHKYSQSSPNSWIESAADEALGLFYVPMGTGDPDIWGGHRTPLEERYDSAIVALDIMTGKPRWTFQNVHHDLWDMDMPSQPSLVDVQTDHGTVPAIYAPAKTGNIFVLDRRNGNLIVPAPERPVPQGPAPGDHLSPTQPFSDLSFRPREMLSGSMMWGATMFDQLACRILFHRMRYEGPFTPPSLQGTLVFPGDLGMFEWGGIAVDPVHQVAIANPMSIPFVSRLLPRGPDNPAAPNDKHPPGSELGVQPMYGTPYGVTLGTFLSPVGIPCLEPPWGYMAAIDLKTNKVVWQHPVGTIRDEAPVPLPFRLGVPMLGGPMVTAGGVAFLTSTMDYYIRAFDVRTGAEIWKDRLPAGGQSDPMTYSEGGRQFVVTADGGHGSFGTKLGDYIVAYALPEQK